MSGQARSHFSAVRARFQGHMHWTFHRSMKLLSFVFSTSRILQLRLGSQYLSGYTYNIAYENLSLNTVLLKHAVEDCTHFFSGP